MTVFQFKAGDRVELIAMYDDPDAVAPGTRGTIHRCEMAGSGTDAFLQVDVGWDDGGRSMLAVPPDELRLIEEE